MAQLQDCELNSILQSRPWFCYRFDAPGGHRCPGGVGGTPCSGLYGEVLAEGGASKGTLSLGFLRFQFLRFQCAEMQIENLSSYRLSPPQTLLLVNTRERNGSGSAGVVPQNTLRMSDREPENQKIKSKIEQLIVSFWRFFEETKEKLENISAS